MPFRPERSPRLLIALLLALGSALPLAPTVPTASAATVSRLSGADRFATAAAISKANFGTGVPVAYVTTGASFPDALAGAPLAAKTRGPVLLVSSSSVPSSTATELGRLKPQRIVILGGTSVIAARVGTELDRYTAGSVSRLAGSDRYATATAVSKAWGSGVSAVYIATGTSFPDALAASAAAARGGFPVLLVSKSAIPRVVQNELSRLAPKRIFVAGGSAVVSETVRRALDAYTTGPVERVAGADRYATAAAISRRHFSSASSAYVATGLSFPDALSAAPVAGIKGGPVLLATRSSLPSATANELSRLDPSSVVIAGGTGVVSSSVASSISSVLAGAPPSGSTASRCPIAMPASAPSGWTRKVTSTFSETTALGRWPGPVAAQAWQNRARGKDTSGRGMYDSSKTVSERNGVLDIWMHSETTGKPGVHDPAGQRYVAAVVSKLGPTKGARITLCMRADVIPGYKIAYLLWPSEGNGNQLGEIDFPEGKLSGLPAMPNAFMHYAPKPTSGKMQDWYDSRVAVQQWHAYTIEWNPKASTPYAKFYVDGRLIGHSTRYVPTVTMRYIMQNETYLGGDALPAPAQGHLQIDWATIDLPN